LALIGLGAGGVARADEADDLQRIIETHKGSVTDLERLDSHGLLREETTLAKVWLDDAWRFRSEQEYEKTREVTDRVAAQEDMIRQKLEAYRLVQEAEAKEKTVKELKDKAEKARQAILQLQIEKKALEMGNS